MKLSILFLAFIASILLSGQPLNLVVEMDSQVEETSGLMLLDGRLITFNDSGGEAALYEVDISSGAILRSVSINNAANVDWEDICHDEAYIYVGDFGNNSGDRTDLVVYRITIDDYLSATQVNADAIHFSYAEQIDFTPNTQTNFDAETILSYHDSLYIFTKNRGNFESDIYCLPKTPGSYQISKEATIYPDGLITGGTYDSDADAILLTGYSSSDPFIITMTRFEDNNISSAEVEKYLVETQGSKQIEGITPIGQLQFYISSEGNASEQPKLYQLDATNILDAKDIATSPPLVYPNPASDIVLIEHFDFLSAKVYNLSGQLVGVFFDREIDVSGLTPGLYFLIVTDREERIFGQTVVVGRE